MFSALHYITIEPLVQLIDFFYSLFFEITGNHGIAVLGLSFVVTILTLPLYMVAEQWQETERKTQEKLKPGIQRIKETFKGDEQYMILSTFYRENHYHPIMALRSSFSLLIQIPFFMAAYNFLSNLEPLKEFSFLFIRNFGEPDAVFKIGSFTINILPIMMTIINCVAGAIYSKGHPLSEKIQIYACASVFLLLLYNSPAGLVVYWTMNNILSLVKNIFYKIKNPRKVLYIIGCAFTAVLLFASIFLLKNMENTVKLFIVLFAILIICLPILTKTINRIAETSFKNLDENPKGRLALFIEASLILAVLSGAAIPSILMESETSQYCYVDNYKSPFIFLFITFYQAAGFFVLWPACFYALFSSKTKKIMSVLFTCGAFVAIVNCFAFSGNYGPIEPNLIFMQPQTFNEPTKNVIMNVFALISATAILCILIKNKIKIAKYLCAITLFSLVGISLINTIKIKKSFDNMKGENEISKIEPVFHLSKNKRNVIVLMQDRLFSPFVPYVLEELPELKEKFDGFSFYKNTISFAVYTMLGTPGIFGGYDYTPYEMNNNPLQKEKTLQQKHNEAILSMPKTFHSAGWNTTVADMPYENYLEFPTDNFYSQDYFKVADENDAVTFNRVTTHGIYSDIWYEKNNFEKIPYISGQIKRNFIRFSAFKMISPALRKFVYHKKYWLFWDEYDNSAKFINNYSELDFLPELAALDSENNEFLLLDNEATHEPIFLQAPEYVPVKNVTNYGTSKFSHSAQYHAVAGTLKRLADFFDYLKENNAYDNTRIIVVSDHGAGYNTGAFEKTDGLDIPKDSFTASLLVKDFDQHGTLKENMDFMTNADTPYLATKDLIQDAKNPWTGSPYQVKDKKKFMKLAKAPAESTRIRHNKQFKIPDDGWYTVSGNIYDKTAWKKFEKKEGK